MTTKTKNWKDNFNPEDVNERPSGRFHKCNSYHYSTVGTETEAEKRIDNILQNISVSNLLSDPNFESITLDEMNTTPDYYSLDRSALNQFPRDWNLEKVYEHLDEYGFELESTTGFRPTISTLVIHTKPSK